MWLMGCATGVFFGLLVGYIVGMQQGSPPPVLAANASSAPATGVSTPGTTTVANEDQIRAYRDIVTRDPKNLQAATQLGNLLYDAGRYVEAIPPYQQAFALDPRNVHVSTDLGTALWYSGRPDDALAQYEKSLAVDATHPQTLFNRGIVRADGKGDYRGAIESWERLLEVNPTYPEIEKLQRLLADARQKITVAGAGTPSSGLVATRTGR